MYLVSLPVVIKDYGAGFFKWIYTFFLRPLVDLEYFGFNALGIFNIFDKNGDKLGGQFPTTVFVVIFGVLIIGVLSNGMAVLGMGEYWQMVLKGLVLVIAVGLDCIGKLHQSR